MNAENHPDVWYPTVSREDYDKITMVGPGFNMDDLMKAAVEANAAAKEEGYPDDNPKTAVGLTKPSFAAIPPSALLALGAAMADGRRKYGLMNYREKTVSVSVYYDAMLRHLFAYWDGENKAQDSGVDHLGHVMACCAILLDAASVGKLNDDRPIPGTFPALVAEATKAAVGDQA